MHKLTCKESSRLLSQAMDAKLTVAQRATLRLHLSVCEACTRFGAQLNTLRAAMRKYHERWSAYNGGLESTGPCRVALCSSCNLPFTCGMRETSEPCWCASLPVLVAVDPAQDCLCPQCLRERIATQGATNAVLAADER